MGAFERLNPSPGNATDDRHSSEQVPPPPGRTTHSSVHGDRDRFSSDRTKARRVRQCATAVAAGNSRPIYRVQVCWEAAAVKLSQRKTLTWCLQLWTVECRFVRKRWIEHFVDTRAASSALQLSITNHNNHNVLNSI